MTKTQNQDNQSVAKFSISLKLKSIIKKKKNQQKSENLKSCVKAKL
jgi:hypothetical protein